MPTSTHRKVKVMGSRGWAQAKAWFEAPGLRELKEREKKFCFMSALDLDKTRGRIPQAIYLLVFTGLGKDL